MARILVVGSVNIDRIWRLDAPLRGGARISYQEIETRYGGGGYYTGRTLLALGHDVRLLTRLANDGPGRQCHAMLEQTGFDTGLVTMIDDETRPFDILVDPSGERTILFSGQGRRAPIAEIPAAGTDIVYLNVQRIDTAAGEALAARHDVVAQFPLAADERRPARILLASRSDVLLEDRDALFAAARSRAGKAMRALVMTNGLAAVRVIEAGGETRAPVPACKPVTDTIGAGDLFAGGFLDAYLRGRPLTDAAHHGSAIATWFLSDRRLMTPVGAGA